MVQVLLAQPAFVDVVGFAGDGELDAAGFGVVGEHFAVEPGLSPQLFEAFTAVNIFAVEELGGEQGAGPLLGMPGAGRGAGSPGAWRPVDRGVQDVADVVDRGAEPLGDRADGQPVVQDEAFDGGGVNVVGVAAGQPEPGGAAGRRRPGQRFVDAGPIE